MAHAGRLVYFDIRLYYSTLALGDGISVSLPRCLTSVQTGPIQWLSDPGKGKALAQLAKFQIQMFYDCSREQENCKDSNFARIPFTHSDGVIAGLLLRTSQIFRAGALYCRPLTLLVPNLP